MKLQLKLAAEQLAAEQALVQKWKEHATAFARDCEALQVHFGCIAYYMHIYIYICIYIYTYLCIYLYVYIYLSISVCVYVYIYIYIYINI